MKIKTSELTGPALDWAVTRALHPQAVMSSTHVWLKVCGGEEDSFLIREYSTNWAEGGPIIERNHISPRLEKEGLYLAPYFNGVAHVGHQPGPSPLIAAMRCYVASELGDEIEIPDELCAPV